MSGWLPVDSHKLVRSKDSVNRVTISMAAVFMTSGKQVNSALQWHWRSTAIRAVYRRQHKCWIGCVTYGTLSTERQRVTHTAHTHASLLLFVYIVYRIYITISISILWWWWWLWLWLLVLFKQNHAITGCLC